jgi:hypothetical protein
MPRRRGAEGNGGSIWWAGKMKGMEQNPYASPRHRLRRPLILLAVGLVVLEFALFMLPDRINLPGGMLGWLVLVAVFHYVIPLALVATLVALAFAYSIRFTIRDVLWLTLFVGLWFAWRTDRGHYKMEAIKYQNMNTKANAHLHYQGLLLDRLDPHWRNFRGSFREYSGKTPAPTATDISN